MSTEFGYFVNLYPNPATTELTLESSHPESLQYQLNLLDLNGRVLRSVSSIELGAVDHQLNVSGLAAGVYVIELTERQSGERLTKPFVKIAE
ncbi:MAG: T9SS type A sorting domain-containing protein [Bacteroidota bacterium]